MLHLHDGLADSCDFLLGRPMEIQIHGRHFNARHLYTYNDSNSSTRQVLRLSSVLSQTVCRGIDITPTIRIIGHVISTLRVASFRS